MHGSTPAQSGRTLFDRLDALSWRGIQWLVFACALLHNAEEMLTIPSFLPRAQGLANSLDLPVLLPSLSQYGSAMAFATLLPFVLVAVGATGRPAAWKNVLVGLVQAGLAWNILLPHIPAALCFRGYAPGFLTAMLVNAPFTYYFFERALREGALTSRQVKAVFAGGLALLFALQPVVFAVV